MIHALMASLTPAVLVLVVCLIVAARAKGRVQWDASLVVQLLAPALFAALAAPLVAALDAFTHGLLGALVLVLLVPITLNTIKAFRPRPK